ncbi:hypothetical protein NONI108955_08775 [Nocardia ninae]|nr:hypothetical protein [Nocardia ninae]
MHDGANQLVKVVCPSRFCMKWVPLVAGKIGWHEGQVPGVCPFIGTRVVDDTTDIDPDYFAKMRTKREA